MAPSSLRSLAAIFIATASLAACTKGAPPASMLDAGATAASAASSSGELGAMGALEDAAPTHAPSAESAATAPAVDELQARAKKLFEAIVKDEPDLAMDMFFPRDAFLALKDVKDPGAYWDKLVKEYKSHIHAYHKRLGKKVNDCEFEVLESNPKGQVYVAPKKEFNKEGYNKITRSKLRYKQKGKPRSFDIATMIDHGGKWYITHLR